MTDFINKVISLILIFIMLVLAPLLLAYLATDSQTERLILNEVTYFIDRVTDKGSITESDLDDLYMAINSHGGAYDAIVERYQTVEEKNPAGGTKLIYLKQDDIQKIEEGTLTEVSLVLRDAIKVTVTEVSRSQGNRLLWALLRIDKGDFTFTLTGTVR